MFGNNKNLARRNITVAARIKKRSTIFLLTLDLASKFSLVILAILLVLIGAVQAYCNANDLTFKEVVLGQPDKKTNYLLPESTRRIRTERPIIAPEVENAEKSAETANIRPQKKPATETIIEPPNQPVASGLAAETTENVDGTGTTIVSDAPINRSELEQAAGLPANAGTPYAVKFSDETGQNAALEKVIKDYLNSVLRWGNEVGELRQIIVKDAGESGWSGQYSGSYTFGANGDITSAFGWITLNTYYYKDEAAFNDYMKLVFSHEYGHHYTLYHKWVDADLPVGSRFPDSYYTIRPLSKETTTVDCTAGWLACEPEIIAEDYSYLYSGYRYHAMKTAFGLPSDPGTRNWFDNISASLTSISSANSAPVVSIVAPVAATLLGDIDFSAQASDDRQVSKVSFYLGDLLLGEDQTAPYAVKIKTTDYPNGDYVLKAVATDSDQVTGQSSLAVTINNQIASTALTIRFTQPASSPASWGGGNLDIRIEAPEDAATRIELYLDDQKVAEENSNLLARRWLWFSGAGQYTLKAKAFDAAGSSSEATLLVNKTL